MRIEEGKFWTQDGQKVGSKEFWADEPAGPVRTVTRKEIVPGNYGPVEVVSAGTQGVSLTVQGIAAVWRTAELRAAAAVFIQLADALEDGQ